MEAMKGTPLMTYLPVTQLETRRLLTAVRGAAAA
jgi:hypothetical protein